MTIASRRDLIKAIGASAAVLPAVENATLAIAQTAPGDRMSESSRTEAFLGQFDTAWRPLDPQLRAVLRSIYGRLMGLPPPSQLSPAELRRINGELSFYWNAGAPALPHVEERTIDVPSGRARVRIYDPGLAAPAATAILLHGGGWVFGNLDTYDGFARQIAKRSGMRCLNVEYALAPEHPFPAPLDDCVAAIRWAASDGASLGIDPKRIVLVGDSAGANLSIAACLSFRDADMHPIRGAALLYGAYSLDLDTPSVQSFGGGPYFLGKADMIRYWNDYLSGNAARQSPLAVPMLADLANLPPLYIAACEFDPLLDDSERFRDRAKSAHAEVEFHLWKGMVHGIVSLMGWVDAMVPQVDDIGSFLRRVTQAGQ